MHPSPERPRERCLRNGPSCLSLRECLALILGSGPPGVGGLGLASRILERPGAGLPAREQERAFFTALEAAPESFGPAARVPGIGDAGAARLMASLELGRRYASYRLDRKTGRRRGKKGRSRAAESLAAIPEEARLDAQEWLGFVPWHRGEPLHPGELCLVERGVRTHVNVDPAELFARVLALRPREFVLVHNHPSGDPSPSDSDYELTRRVQFVSSQLGIPLLGHWVVAPGSERWISVV